MTGTIVIELFDNPQGKGRPRFVSINGKARTYTPKGTEQAEREIRLKALSQIPAGIPKDAPVSLDITFFVRRPKYLVRKTQPMQDEVTTKPDIDNLQKTVLDALNGKLYNDDSQVWELKSRKLYVDGTPKIVIGWKIVILWDKIDKKQFLNLK